ncbi:DUF6377 domain-containing protein [Carboxylicivirga caseinilyticus]|uniref:DUF6377 domain-containing protein n=1 Tax=Carboxylicivirga caseinilyticus TaxID=3417572 RepID=UPI003D3469D6|nr:hypothetical protein [Marinilabiliaceae bacterium A049]
MKKSFLILLYIHLSTLAFASVTTELDSLFIVLNKTMSERSKYQAIKENKINGLKSLLNESELTAAREFYVNNRLLIEYLPFNFDSAVHYIDRNLELARLYDNREFKNETNLHLANLLAFSGRYLEALDVVKKVDSKKINKEQKQEYYSIFTKIYSELFLFTPAKENIELYRAEYHAYADTLLKFLDPSSEEYLAIKEKEYRDNRNMIDCKRINTQRLAMAESGTRIYSMITFERAILYKMEHDLESAKKYLILSAISDIKAAVKDNASLTDLAMILFNEDNIDDAYRYIMFSFEDAAFYNSRLRYVQISNILPLISEAYQLKTNRQKSELRRYLITISLLSIILLIAIIAIFTQIKSLRNAKDELIKVNDRLRELNDELQTANTELYTLNHDLVESDMVKEHYIGSFLAICSDYIDKLDDFRKMVNKNIVGHKVEELYTTTKSRKLIEKEVDDFYNSFDNIFLHLFPDFVDQINNLLLEDEKIELKKDEPLPTEIRIFALIRLGIKDSSKIAHLLRYSVNTIYNYRVKIKNKAAVPREEFEDYIMKIGSKII